MTFPLIHGISTHLSKKDITDLLAVGHFGSPRAQVLSTEDWSQVATASPSGSSPAFVCIFSNDGAFYFIGADSSATDKAGVVYDSKTHAEITKIADLESDGTGVSSAAFSEDGQFLAIGGMNGEIYVYRTSDWSRVAGTPSLPSEIRGVAYSLDGNFLFVGSRDYGFYKYDTNDWSISASVTIHSSNIECVSNVSADGESIAIWHRTSTEKLHILNTSDLSEQSGHPSGFSGVASALGYSKDGRYFALVRTTTPYVLVYDATGPELSRIFDVPAGPGTCIDLSWSHDGSMLAATSNNSPYLVVYNTSDWSFVPGTPVLPSYGRGVGFASSPK